MQLTDEAYYALSKLEKWYRKYTHQVIEISGVVGTGVFDVVREFLLKLEFDPREIMYLSYDQKLVLELAAKRCHAYYLPSIIYKYTREVNFDSLSVINPKATALEYEWKKDVRKKIDPRYKIMIVFDSSLLNRQTMEDLCSFGVPIILLRDPAMLPSPDSYTFLREPNIEIRELNPQLLKNPITYFANKALRGERMALGAYDTVSIVPKKQLNLYNLKSSDMIITLSDEMMNSVNSVYREKVMKLKNPINVVGERIIIMNNLHAHKLVNEDEKNIKIFLTRGLVGYISKCNKHALSTKYIPIEFKTEFYHEPFTDLYLDRHYLNRSELPSRQQIPDEILLAQYAYALSVPMARLNHWDKVTIIADTMEDDMLQRKMLYNAITRCKQSLTMVL